ncbi:malonyl-ACP O-methyltransferase BioC [Ideonella oryzae]|uniref:Malonyl-[acyl-carrier protein] O-methyltransferase n=1 Tax=Ideonella oryzae TaxID=2937441 RepID=A0ABT1BPE1_9BURK|nr:malonyl-ACP O-methyltransferase BioC [Ideonella oryzae]MCO5977983.1 malonyl-ACP O-methyltransferase BioC [Ideonella oryzae]
MALKVHVMGNPGLPTLFCIHGFASNAQIWQPLAEALGDRFALHAVDLPGCGASPASNADLDAALDELLRSAPAGAIWVGWSLGGMLALAAAARATPRKVSGVVTVAASPKFLASTDWPTGVPQQLFDAVYAGADDVAGTLRRFAGLELKGCLGSELRQHLKWLQAHAQQPAPDSPTLRAELDWLARLDVRSVLGTLTIPVRHVLAGQDAVLPAACAEAVVSLTGRPGDVSVLADAPHALPLTHAAALAQVIDALWQQLRRPPLQSRVAQAFSKAATAYEQRALLQRRLAFQLLDRLPAAAPESVRTVLDLGCGTGYCLPALQQAYPQARVIGLDLASGMLAQARAQWGDRFEWICAPAEHMPLPDASVDVVYSSLALQWCDSFSAALAEVHRVLKPGGTVVLNTLAEGTLQELAEAWATVDDLDHVHRFPSAQALLAQVDATLWTVDWQSCADEVDHHLDIRSLANAIKGVGAHHMQPARTGLGGRRALQAWMAAMERFRTPQGLPARYRVLSLSLTRRPA